MQEFITVDKIRKYFEDKTGLPKKEIFITSIDLLKKESINIDRLSKMERRYYLQLIGAHLKYLRDMYRNHHCNFLSIRKKGSKFIYHGFSNNKDCIDNNLKRIEDRKKSLILIFKQVKELTEEQILLLKK